MYIRHNMPMHIIILWSILARLVIYIMCLEISREAVVRPGRRVRVFDQRT